MPIVYHIPNPKWPSDLTKGYVGVTKNTVEQRFWEHQHSKDSIVGKAIRKYKLTSSDVVILNEYNDENDAYNFERELRPKAKIGWNIAPGGVGGYRGPMSEDALERLRERMTGQNNPRYQTENPPEMRAKISSTLMSKSEEWRKQNASNGGKGLKGYKRPQSTKDKFKEVSINRPRYTCEHCGKVGQYNSMIAYHGDRCKYK